MISLDPFRERSLDSRRVNWSLRLRRGEGGRQDRKNDDCCTPDSCKGGCHSSTSLLFKFVDPLEPKEQKKPENQLPTMRGSDRTKRLEAASEKAKQQLAKFTMGDGCPQSELADLRVPIWASNDKNCQQWAGCNGWIDQETKRWRDKCVVRK